MNLVELLHGEGIQWFGDVVRRLEPVDAGRCIVASALEKPEDCQMTGVCAFDDALQVVALAPVFQIPAPDEDHGESRERNRSAIARKRRIVEDELFRVVFELSEV